MPLLYVYKIYNLCAKINNRANSITTSKHFKKFNNFKHSQNYKPLISNNDAFFINSSSFNTI